MVRSKTTKSNPKKPAIDLADLAHAGTRESLSAIEAHIEVLTDEQDIDTAYMYRDMCAYIYYDPKTPDEEEQLQLAVLIYERESRLMQLTFKHEALAEEAERLVLAGEIHAQLIAAHPAKAEAWSMHYSQELVELQVRELTELTEELEYMEAWIALARQSLTIERYREMPHEYLDLFTEDDDTCDCGACMSDDDCMCDECMSEEE